MTEVVVHSSNASCCPIQRNSPTRNDGLYQHTHQFNNNNPTNNTSLASSLDTNNTEGEEEVGGGERKRRREEQEEAEAEAEERDYLNNIVGLFFTAFRRSVFGCSSCEISKGGFSSGSGSGSGSGCGGMEIGLPTNVRHVAHVTFDRFNGFLGLPVEFEPEVPRRAPSASTRVFGVSTNSMQLSFDTRGNSVPTILLMMQHRLYALRGLQAEGIFRINPDNGQEEYVRDELNRGLIPDDVDVHCLAGLIKAWFRELPTGILDCLSPEQVMESQTEEECTRLARLLPPTEAALLDWAINLMADVAQFEYLNKMNARNVAMVFAPNMTHMADPLTALMHAVQVMNFLKTLIEKTLKEREDSIIDSALDSYSRDPSGGNGQHSLQTILEESTQPDTDEDQDSRAVKNQDDSSIENIVPGENQSSVSNRKDDESTQDDDSLTSKPKDSKTTATKSEVAAKPCDLKSSRTGQTSTTKRGPQKNGERPVVQVVKSAQKTKGSSLVSSMNLRAERIEAWR